METTQDDSTNTVKPLRRRAGDRMIAGVAGGLGDYTGFDPVIFRIGFIFLTVLGGAGIVLYLLGWLLIPKATDVRSHAEDALGFLRGLPSWVGIVAVAIGAALLVGSLGFWDAEFLWAAALIAVGFVLLRDNDRTTDDPGPGPVGGESAAPPGSPGAPDETGTTRVMPALTERTSTEEDSMRADTTARMGASTIVDSSAPAAVPGSRSRRERSSLGWFTIAAVLVAVGAAAVLENWNVLTLDVGQFFALALAVLGAGLLVGAWWGRARLLILLGLVLVPFVLASSLIDVPLRGTVGDRFLFPQTVSALDDSYEVLAGNLTLSLEELRLDEDVHVDASIAMGDLDIIVPRGVRVLVNGTAKAGALSFFEHSERGFDLRRSVMAGDLDAERTISLDIEAGIASVDVYWGGRLREIKGGGD